MKISYIANLAALAVAFVFTTAAAADAATCSVPDGYPTIQSAVDDPSCSTISVAPGLYNENVSIPRSLTLNGAQAGQAVTARTAGGPDESTIRGANPTGSLAVITITAVGVTVDGFTIRNTVTAGAATGIRIQTGGTDAVVMENIFDTISSADVSSNGTAQGVYLENGPDNVNISSNAMQNISSTQFARGIWLGNRASTDPSDDVFIRANFFFNIASSAGEASAVMVDNGAGLGGGARPQLFNNDVRQVTGATAARGFDFETNTGFSYLLDNSFTDLNGPTVAGVRYNYPQFYQTELHGNNFNLPVTAYGIEVDAAIVRAADPNNPLNAACNWWGSPDGPGPVGPGKGARVSPLVLFAPWRIAPAPDGQCTGNNVPTAESQCKQGGWTRAVRPDGSTFKNQGDCVQFVNTGK